MSPKPDVSQTRREQILAAAERVFSRLGFANARVDDIVAEAGLSKGALYWYYESKDQIILALIDRVFTGEMRESQNLVSAPGPAGERLKTFMRVALAEVARFKPLLPLGYEFVALAARRKSVREAIGNYYQQYHSLLVQIIQQGIQSGEFSQVDPDMAALQLLALGEGLALIWFVSPQWVDLDSLGDAPIEMFLKGVLRRNQ